MLNATDLNKIMAAPLACEYGDTGIVKDYMTNIHLERSRLRTVVEVMFEVVFYTSS